MKKLIILLCYFITLSTFSQNVDTIIKTPIYESHYSFKYKNPIYVKYKLYHGGGNCNRSQFTFKVDKVKNTATNNDYSHCGFDEGHLVPAEDFAYDCEKMGWTFKFYNCLPQTPHLNRGIWKHYESEIRKLSQTDSLEIICGGVFSNAHLTNSTVGIPDNCWKIVKSLSTGKIIYALWFDNLMESSSVKNMPLLDLEKKIGFNVY